MAARLSEAKRALSNAALSDTLYESSDDFIISPLILQGQEELGFFVSCSNPSTAGAITSALRCMTARDVIKGLDRQTGRFLWSLWKGKRKATGPNNYKPGALHSSLLLDGSRKTNLSFPVLRWTRTVVSFRLDLASLNVITHHVKGAVAATIRVNLAPGLSANVQDLVFHGTPVEPKNAYYLAHLGQHDYEFATHQPPKLIDTRLPVFNRFYG